MRRLVLIISLFYCLSPIWGQAQKSLQEQLWDGFDNAIQQDVKLKQEKEKKQKEEQENKLFQECITSLKDVLANKHSNQQVQKAKDLIEKIKGIVEITPERELLLSSYDQLISAYGNEAKRFWMVFDGEITDENYVRYTNDSIQNLSIPMLKTICKKLKEHYLANGLESLAINKDYVYLNNKLSNLKDLFKDLENKSNNDKGLFYGKLEKIVSIEREISDEHTEYHPLNIIR